MSLQKLRSDLDNKIISATELCEVFFKKIHEHDHKINSFISLCPEFAEKQAISAQKLIDEKNASPLCGIPIAIKDNICTKGIKTTCASKMLEDFVPIDNAEAVFRLFNDGAVLLGKTNMDEFAMGSSSQTSYFGGVKNPHDPDFVPGGSSGGSAAAVAAGFAPVALGSDTGGSVRQPSAFCGVTGFKPTYGAVSRYGLIAFASSLEQIGVIANSATDCGYILNSISGYDPKDLTTLKHEIDFLSKVGASLKGLRIGIIKELFSSNIDSEIKKSIMSAAEYYKKIGCEILEVSMPSLEFAVSSYYLISSAEAASNLSRYDGIKFTHRSDSASSFDELIKRSRKEGFGSEVKRRIMLGNYALSSGYYEEYYQNAKRIQRRIASDFEEVFKSCDVLLSPTAPSLPDKIGNQGNDPVKMYLSDICTVPANIAGLPSVSTVSGYSENSLPIGMSLTGPALGDALVIALADRFEKDFTRKELVL